MPESAGEAGEDGSRKEEEEWKSGRTKDEGVADRSQNEASQSHQDVCLAANFIAPGSSNFYLFISIVSSIPSSN